MLTAGSLQHPCSIDSRPLDAIRAAQNPPSSYAVTLTPKTSVSRTLGCIVDFIKSNPCSPLRTVTKTAEETLLSWLGDYVLEDEILLDMNFLAGDDVLQEE